MYDIRSFMTWFINQFITIGANMLAKLDQILIYNNVSLMDFIITIAVIGAFIGIITTAPRLGIVNRSIRSERSKNDKQ